MVREVALASLLSLITACGGPARPAPSGPAAVPMSSAPDTVRAACAPLPIGSCPELLPRVEGRYRARAWGVPAGQEDAGKLTILDVWAGGPYPGLVRRNAPPRFAHVVVRVGAALEGADAFTVPDAGEPPPSGPPTRARSALVDLGTVTWGGRRGTLFLAPSYPTAGLVGDHLVFRWRDGGLDREVSLHSWRPLAECRATLAAIVRSIG